MSFIRSFIHKVLGAIPFLKKLNKPVIEEAPFPPHGQQDVLIQTPQPPVQLPVDQIPQTLAEAIAYVRMGEPKSSYSDVVTWHNICGQLRNKYKALALDELRGLLLAIHSDSLTETEKAIDKALLKLKVTSNNPLSA